MPWITAAACTAGVAYERCGSGGDVIAVCKAPPPPQLAAAAPVAVGVDVVPEREC